MYNKVILVGRVVAPPEARVTSTGKNVASFRMAVDRPFSSGPNKVADFFSITAWDKLGDICAKYLNKGKLILVEGRLQTRTYENKDGIQVKTFDIVANDMKMLSSARDSEGGAPARSGGYGGGAVESGAGVDFADDDPMGDSVPF